MSPHYLLIYHCNMTKIYCTVDHLLVTTNNLPLTFLLMCLFPSQPSFQPLSSSSRVSCFPVSQLTWLELRDLSLVVSSHSDHTVCGGRRGETHTHTHTRSKRVSALQMVWLSCTDTQRVKNRYFLQIFGSCRAG